MVKKKLDLFGDSSQPSMDELFARTVTNAPAPSLQEDDPKKEGVFRSVLKFGGGVGTGILKGIGSTISGASSAGEKLLRGTVKTVLPKGVERAIGIGDDEDFVTGAEQVIPQEIFKPEGTAEKIGFYGEQIAEFLIPGGAATKASKAVSRFGKGIQLGTRVGAEIVEGAGITALQTGGNIGEMKKDAYISAALPLFGAAAKGVKRGLTPSKGFLGKTGEILTGIQGEKLNKWYDLAKMAPHRIENAKAIITKNPKDPFMGLTESVANALKSTKKAAQKAYKKGVKLAQRKYKDSTFFIGNKLPLLNEPLKEFNLKIVGMPSDNILAKNTALGRVMDYSNAIVVAGTRTSPFTPAQLREINSIVEKIRIPDLSVDELVDIDASIRVILDKYIKEDNKKMIPLYASLLENTNNFIDTVLPEINDANKLYKSYYEALENGGKKIIDSQDKIRPGAENYIKNVNNANKGVQKKRIKKMEKSLGINILENVDDVKLAKEMLETVPQTTKNRFMDFLRARLSSDIFGAGAGLGVLSVPVVAIPALLVNILSSPKQFSGLIEHLAGRSSKIPKKEINLINNLLQGIIANLNDEKSDKDQQ